MTKSKIVLAYSGGLDTSVAIKWFQQELHYEVIAICVDVSEGKDLAAIKQKALDIGASKCIVIDAKQEFAEHFILPALKANALYEGIYPLVSALSRPLIAKLLVEVAQQENAQYVAHGCTGKGNDQVRFDVSIKALAPHLNIIAPVREYAMSRTESITYANKHNIPLPINLDNPFSVDQNLWGRSCECGVLEDPWAEPPEAAYDWTKNISETPDLPEEIEITFHQGYPVALNGEEMALPKLIEVLNAKASLHGVGRIDHIENRLVGIKSREVYEAPAAMTLITAHNALEAMTLPREVAHFKPLLEKKLTELIYEGLWYSPLKKAVCAFIDETQLTVSGCVRVKLFKGHAIIVGRKSPHSLYQLELATYNSDDQFDHKAALGFIKLWGLPTEVFTKVNS